MWLASYRSVLENRLLYKAAFFLKNAKWGDHMEILLVDDEKLTVEVIRNMINWKIYGIDQVYMCYSMKQAIEIMERHQISILVCDIEMPKGSGLELLSWVREQELDIIAIFLSSHALFSYAMEAIRLKAMAYLLKPIQKREIETAIQEAVEKVELNRQTEQNKKFANYWNSGKDILWQDFWKKYLFRDLGDKEEAVLKQAQKAGIYINAENRYYPILLYWSRRENMGTFWDDEILEFSLKNIISESLFHNSGVGNMIILNAGSILILYQTDRETDVLMQERSRIMVEQCRKYLKFFNIKGYVKKIVPLAKLRESVRYLLEKEKNDVLKSGALSVVQETVKAFKYEKPEMSAWARELFLPDYEKVLKEIKIFLTGISLKACADPKVLGYIQQDFLQVLYIEMEHRGIHANAIFGRPEMTESFRKAGNTVDNMINWFREVAEFLQHYDYKTGKLSDMVRETKKYIEENSGEQINRNVLAGRVYLHPDYLNRIFKEQVGTSISDYIIQVRLEKAKILLLKKDENISAIASEVGYPNTAYFTRIFKRAFGTTPKEYRRR